MAAAASLSVRLQGALGQPVAQVRCEEVGRLLQEAGTSKDAGHLLRAVTESIFGLSLPSAAPPLLAGGWGLRGVTRSAQPREFDHLRAFLGPAGPLLGLTYRLASDPYQLFEFPLAWLPVKSRAEIEDGSPSGFYASKVQYPGPGKPPANIMLNAFEYYMFHFAYFLVSSGSQRWALSWATAGDALYPSLLEDYLTTFLPCDNSLPPGPPSPPVSPRAVLTPLSPRSAGTGNPNLYLSSLVSPIAPRPPQYPQHPLHSPPHSFLGCEGGGVGGGGPSTSSPLHRGSASPHNPHLPHASVWSSQVVVQVLMELWVNQCLPPPQPRTAPSQRPPPSSPAPPHPTQEVFVPSSDHVRVVRMVIKHLHFFANSAKAAQPSPLDHLRKKVWSLYRKSLYQFLGHTFRHWPLDSSFRLVLETWLSYIQPWRYLDYAPPAALSPPSTRSPGPGGEPEGRSVEARWQPFVAENLLFYSLLLQQLLPRLFRLDLSAPRNAQILFRVTKVFSQQPLNSFIQEVEEALQDPHLLHRSLLSGPGAGLGLGPGPGGAHHGDARSLASLARAHCLEMEGPGHSYQPMFSPGNIALVESLLRQVRAAYEAVLSEQQHITLGGGSTDPPTGGKGARMGRGWWAGLLRSLFESSAPTEEENSAEDIRKTVVHLETAQRQLSAIFNVSQDLGHSLAGGHQGVVGGSYLDPSFYHHHHHHHQATLQADVHVAPHHVDTPSGPVLTAYGRQQLRSGLRRRDLKYEGDPDLRPICSYEVPFLVRWLYYLALLANTKYGARMARLYLQQDVVGLVARLVLQAPETVFQYQKHSSGSPPHSRLPKHLPPRLSLRFQASKHTIACEVAAAFLLYVLGLWTFLFKAIAILFLLVALPAFFLHRHLARPSLPAQETRGCHQEGQPPNITLSSSPGL